MSSGQLPLEFHSLFYSEENEWTSAINQEPRTVQICFWMYYIIVEELARASRFYEAVRTDPHKSAVSFICSPECVIFSMER